MRGAFLFPFSASMALGVETCTIALCCYWFMVDMGMLSSFLTFVVKAIHTLSISLVLRRYNARVSAFLNVTEVIIEHDVHGWELWRQGVATKHGNNPLPYRQRTGKHLSCHRGDGPVDHRRDSGRSTRPPALPNTNVLTKAAVSK